MLKLQIEDQMADARELGDDLKKTTVFFATDQRDWLDEVKGDSIRAHDEISVSAVVRLAVSRLAAAYPSYAQIKQQLPHSEKGPPAPGRPRR